MSSEPTANSVTIENVSERSCSNFFEQYNRVNQYVNKLNLLFWIQHKTGMKTNAIRKQWREQDMKLQN